MRSGEVQYTEATTCQPPPESNPEPATHEHCHIPQNYDTQENWLTDQLLLLIVQEALVGTEELSRPSLSRTQACAQVCHRGIIDATLSASRRKSARMHVRMGKKGTHTHRHIGRGLILACGVWLPWLLHSQWSDHWQTFWPTSDELSIWL